MVWRGSILRLELTEPNHYIRRIDLQRSHIEGLRLRADWSFYVETAINYLR